MARRLTLHIGTMKSGTSFIQNVLSENRSRLREEQGVLFPGRRWREQVSAVHDLIERGGPKQATMDPEGPWHRIVREVNEWDGEAVISMEFLAPREGQKIEQIRRSFEATDLHVVATARDLARSVPAMWQESVQNNATSSWPEFLAAVRDEPQTPGPGKWFWRHQGVAEIAGRWSKAMGRDHFTLITVPPPGSPPSLLWERFAAVAGIDPAGCSLDVRVNPSIGVASAMVMRQVNAALATNPLSKPDYHKYVKHALAKRALAARKKSEPALGLDEPWVYERGRVEVERLRALDLRIVGDLDELLPRPVAGEHTDRISAEQQLAAAVDGLAALVQEWSADAKTSRKRKKRKKRRKDG